MMLKKLKRMMMLAILGIGVFAYQSEATAAVYTVKQGESLWKIGAQYGVPVPSIVKINNLKNYMIYPGQKLQIPAGVSQSDKDLLARLVQAEAVGESYAGKVAVATVVLNRVDSPDFPNSVREVIYQVSNGYYAFTPVANGQINKPAGPEAVRAVNEALAYRGQGKGSLFFYNPKTSTSKWIFSREVTVVIGNHRFAK